MEACKVKSIKLAILRFYGMFRQDHYAIHRADECLTHCQIAFTKKMLSDPGRERLEAWKAERFWARQHNRFWRLAFRKPAFSKD